MSGDGVHPFEMYEPHDLDDAAADALIAGHGHGLDAGLAALVGDMRVAYSSHPPALGTELSALLSPAPAPAPAALPPRRFEKMRSSVIAKVGAATATLLAATGGLAVAHALPAPVQDAVSSLGIGEAETHHVATTVTVPTTVDTATTTDPTTVPSTGTTEPDDTKAPGVTTPTTAEPGKGVAESHDTQGFDSSCEHRATPDAEGPDGAVKTNPVGPPSSVPCIPPVSTTPTSEAQSDGEHGHQTVDVPTTTATTPSTSNGDRGSSGGSNPSSGDHGGSSGSGEGK